MLLSALFVHFRDIQPIWEVVSQILFYASPVIISIETMQAEARARTLLHIYMLNPLAVILSSSAMRCHATLTPSAGAGARQLGGLLGPARDRRGDLRRRLRVFNRAAAKIAENL